MARLAFATAFLCCAAGLVSTVHAQVPANAAEFKALLVPTVGGWYSPASNFGGITFDLNFDAARPIAAGEWQFQDGGVARTVFFQADVQYMTDAEFRNTGTYATLESPTFTFIGRGDYNDSDYLGIGTPVLTGRSIRIEFHSSREATFIDNPGQADEREHPIVATLRGLPLVAAEDYSGEWITIARYVIGNAFLRTAELKLTLTPHVLGETQVIDSYPDNSTLPIPQAESRVYSVACAELNGFNDPLRLDGCELFRAAASTCSPYENIGERGCLPGGMETMRTLIWVNPDENGSMANVTEGLDGVTTFYKDSPSFPQTFAAHDRMTIRTFGPPDFSEGDYLREVILFRIPENF